MSVEQPALRPQRRSRKIAMADDEVDAFLAAERTVRVATTGTDGPHVAPLWFVWLRPKLWLYSITRSQRFADLQRDPRVAVVADGGEDYGELHGVELRGRAEPVGESPRTGEPNDELEAVEQAMTAKYFGGGAMHYDGRHGWLQIVPEKITSWDFRKIAD